MYKATYNFPSKSVIDKGRADSRFARYFVTMSLIGWAQARGGYSVRKMMGVCRWPLKIGPKKIEGKMKFGA